jgi:hypothetical protein
MKGVYVFKYTSEWGLWTSEQLPIFMKQEVEAPWHPMILSFNNKL